MDGLQVLALLFAVILAAVLMVALLKPELFS